jgi:hypothetical protein
MKYLLILCSILVPLCSFAEGGSAGNGGDVVLCESEDGSFKAELLDVFEARFFKGTEAERLRSGSDPVGTLDNIFKDVSRISPLRAQRWEKAAKDFFSKVLWVEKDLVDIPDSRHAVLPAHCNLRQLAIQKTTEGVLTYTIDRRLWDLMDNANRAALVLHEILYTDALQDEQPHSIKTRSLVGHLISRDFETGPDNEIGWKISSLEKIATINARLNDYRLKDGSILFVQPTLFDKLLYASSSWPTDISVCGFILPNGDKVNNCEKYPARWMRIRTDGHKIYGFDPVAGAERMRLRGEYFGLPIPMYAYTPGSMIDPAEMLHVENEHGTFYCVPGEPIRYSSRSLTFNPQTISIQSCKLNPSLPSVLKRQGVSYPIKSFSLPKNWESTGPMAFFDWKHHIVFSAPQPLDLFGHRMQVLSILPGNEETIVTLGSPMNWNLAGSVCQVENKFSYRSFRFSNYASGSGLHMEFSRDCLLKRPTGSLNVLRGLFALESGIFPTLAKDFSADLKLRHPATIKLDRQEFEVGTSITFRFGHVRQAQLMKDTLLTVWDIDIWDHIEEEKVRRLIPGGTILVYRFNESNNNERLGRAFKERSTLDYVDLKESLELPLIMIEEREGRMRKSPRPTMVKVHGHLNTLGGRLNEGILAEEATVPVLIKDDGYGYKVENQKLPAGTKIDWDYRLPLGYAVRKGQR